MKNVLKKYFNGIKFGMIVELAIGPMCLMVFNTAKNFGLMAALSVVLIVALVDALYITLASIGASKIMGNKKMKKIITIAGAFVLILFGVKTIINAYGIRLISGFQFKTESASIAVQALILALSNPIAIVFWGSVLTTKIINDKMKKKEIFVFASGCITAALMFLSSVAVLGTVVSNFISDKASNILNIAVGTFIIMFAFWGHLPKTA